MTLTGHAKHRLLRPKKAFTCCTRALSGRVPSNRRVSIARICSSTGLVDQVRSITETAAEDIDVADVVLGKRSLLVLAAATIPWMLAPHSSAETGSAAASSSTSPETAAEAPALKDYRNKKQGYSLSTPSSWERKDKAGADVLFEDPARRSTSVGVTVNPVRVRQIQDFGSLQQVGDKLLEAERAKESTKSAALLSQSQRELPSGATLYDYEYDLDSTRGRKRILNTVTIFNGQLYILNAAYKCEKGDEGCNSEAAVATVALLREVAASFAV